MLNELYELSNILEKQGFLQRGLTQRDVHKLEKCECLYALGAGLHRGKPGQHRHTNQAMDDGADEARTGGRIAGAGGAAATAPPLSAKGERHFLPGVSKEVWRKMILEGIAGVPVSGFSPSDLDPFAFQEEYKRTFAVPGCA